MESRQKVVGEEGHVSESRSILGGKSDIPTGRSDRALPRKVPTAASVAKIPRYFIPEVPKVRLRPTRVEAFSACLLQAGRKSLPENCSPHTPCADNRHTECADYESEPTMKRIRLAVVINAIVLAGAERMLVRVLARLRPDEFDVQVFTIGMPGPFTEHLEQLGIPNRLYEFLRPKLPNPWHLLTLARDLRRFRPDVVQGWMYLGNLYGGVAAKLARRDMPIAWNIRHSTLNPQIDSRSMRWSAWLGGQLSGFVPDRIVLCAEAARAAHLRVGYAPEKLEVIPNGFDLEQLRPNPVARQRIRAELGISDDTPLVGLIGRLHQHKDHPTFVRAARVVADHIPNAHFVGAGEEQTYSAKRWRAAFRAWQPMLENARKSSVIPDSSCRNRIRNSLARPSANCCGCLVRNEWLRENARGSG